MPMPRSLSARTSEANTVKDVRDPSYSSSRNPSPPPAQTLYVLRQAGLDIERNACTTTNFEDFTFDEIAMAVGNKQSEGFDLWDML